LERRFSLDMPSDKARERMVWILKTELRRFEAGGQEYRQTYGHSPNRDGTHSLSIPFAGASGPIGLEPGLLRPIRIEYVPAPGNITEIRATCTDPAFEEYLDRLIARLKGNVEGTGTRSYAHGRLSWVPNDPAAFQRWRMAYEWICELRRIYQGEYDELERNDPEPTLGDCADYIASKPEWKRRKPSDKTVSRIKRSGDRGWLD